MEDARVQAALRRFWDEVAAGRPAAPGDLDPEIIETIRWLRTLDDGPAPDPAYAARLKERLMHAIAMPLPVGDPLSTPGRNGRWAPAAPLPVRPPAPPSSGRRMPALLATALLLVLTVIGGVLSLGPGWFDRRDEVPPRLPAVAGSPAPLGEIATETLLDAAVGGLPAGQGEVGVDRWTLRPSPTALNMPALPGIVVIVVESGSVVVAVDGADHVLAAGDYLSLTDEPGLTLRANGATPAVALIVYALPGINPNAVSSGSVLGWEYDQLAYNAEYPIGKIADALPGGPGRLRLERTTLSPGAALPPEEASPLVWFGLGSGTLGITLEGERLPFRWTAGEERKVVLGQSLPLVSPGTLMTLRNAGDRPLVLYRLSITPIPGGTPMP